MPNPLARARWRAPARLLALILPTLTGCGGPSAETRLAAHQTAIDPPRLWEVTAFDPAGAPLAALRICADSTLIAGFARAGAEVNGQPCVTPRPGVERPGLYATRCELNGRRFGITATHTGDLARDFTVAFGIHTLDAGPQGVARQVRRFRALGPCPSGWSIGDQAKVGAPRGENALSGTWGE